MLSFFWQLAILRELHMKSQKAFPYVGLELKLAAAAEAVRAPPATLDPFQPEADALLFAARSRRLEVEARVSALKVSGPVWLKGLCSFINRSLTWCKGALCPESRVPSRRNAARSGRP